MSAFVLGLGHRYEQRVGPVENREHSSVVSNQQPKFVSRVQHKVNNFTFLVDGLKAADALPVPDIQYLENLVRRDEKISRSFNILFFAGAPLLFVIGKERSWFECPSALANDRPSTSSRQAGGG